MNAQTITSPIIGRVASATQSLSRKVSARSALAIGLVAYLGAAGLAIWLYFVSDGLVEAAAYLFPSVLALIALITGPIVYRPASRLPWRFLALGQAAFVLGDLIWFSYDLAGVDPFPSFADGFYLLGYPLFAIGLVLFIAGRGSRHHLARLIDAAAIGTVCAVLLVGGVAGQLTADAGLDGVGVLTLLAYPVGDVVLLTAAAYVLFAGSGWRGNAQRALLVGFAMLLAADTLYDLFLADTNYSTSVLDGLWLLSYVAVGLSALLPSMRALTEPRAAGQGEETAGRAMAGLLAVTALIVTWDIVERFGLGLALVSELAEVGIVALLIVRAREVAGRDAQHERQLTALLADTSDAVAVIGPDGVVRIANPAAGRLIGSSPETFIGRSISEMAEMLHPDERPATADWMNAILRARGESGSREARIRNGAGGYRWLDITTSNRIGDQAIDGVVLTLRDITERRESEQRAARLATAVEQASEAVVIADPTGRIEYVNPAFERVTGYSAKEAIGQNPRLLKSGRQPEAFYEAMWATLTAGRPWVADFINRRKDGSEYQSAAVISSIRAADGTITGYVGVSRDVTAERREEAQTARLARERALIAETIRGLDTRESAEAMARAICSQVASLPGVVTSALVIFEPDGRAIPYGIVSATGEPLARRRLPSDRVVDLRAQAQKGPWIEAWHDRPGHPYNDTLSGFGVKAVAYAPIRDGGDVIGYLLISSADEDAEETLSTALPALVEFADISATLIGPKVAERTQTEVIRRRVATIIETTAFTPVYQPIVDIFSDRIVGFEALTRFNNGRSPEQQFAEAAMANMGRQLEMAAVARAVAGAQDLPAGAWLNVNASPALILGGDDFARLALNSPRPLIIELTEHEQIRDYARFRAAVRGLGPNVRLAVDDAGAGFSSLRHILELQPSFVKLDRALVTNIDDDHARQALVAGLLHFARDGGFWLIAEGVETEAELQTLRELEVHYAQGYLLGKPQPSVFGRAPTTRRRRSASGKARPTNGNGDISDDLPVEQVQSALS
jgi:PAS domain S-box-containing protein